MDKVERYNWAKTGDNGKTAWVEVGDLYVDHSYQRPQVSLQNTRAIASEFSWLLFGSLVVMQRSYPDGKMYIVDGQQRWLAAKLRNEKKVPCRIFASDGPSHEAQAFLDLQLRRVRVSAVAQFHAATKAKIEPQATIQKWLDEVSIQVQSHGSPSAIDFPFLLIESWKRDEKATKQAIQLQRLIDPVANLNGEIHKGLWWLLIQGVDVAKESQRIERMGGQQAMLREIKRFRTEMDFKRGGYSVSGRGILQLINRHRRNKIRIDNVKERAEKRIETGF